MRRSKRRRRNRRLVNQLQQREMPTVGEAFDWERYHCRDPQGMLMELRLGGSYLGHRFAGVIHHLRAVCDFLQPGTCDAVVQEVWRSMEVEFYG